MEEGARKYRNYDSNSLKKAYEMVRIEGKTIYFAAKHCNVPWSTLKRYIENENDTIVKMGRPFALPSDLELKLFHYIIEMQELGFGLTVLQIRKRAYDLAKAVGREKMLSTTKEIASKWWWAHFKERYGLCLRVPENLSAYRASMGNKEMVKDFFIKLNDLVTALGIKDKSHFLWNCDETGMSYVVKPSRIVTAIGKKYIYRRTYAEHGQTQTLLACICANGTWIPPMIIFKGVRWNDNLATDALPNSLVKLSPKGWINSELFLEWLKFFISAIPPERPVILLMDSHSAHIGPEVLDIAKSNQIYLMTFPAHCTHILQPLDVGIFKSLKSHWRQSMANYMTNNPSCAPNRSNFHSILNPAFISALTARNIVNAYKKTGICPLDASAISEEVLRPSTLTDRPMMSPQATDSTVASCIESSSAENVQEILKTPKASEKKAPNTKPKRDSSAKCLTPIDTNTISPGPSRPASISALVPSASSTTCLTPIDTNTISPGPSRPASSAVVPSASSTKSAKSKKAKSSRNEDDWECGLCETWYSEDVKKKNGAEWIQCSYCLIPYHENCVGLTDMDVADQLYYRCDNCVYNLK